MAAQAFWTFVFGLASIITPCVLPLVPGYLSAVSSVEVRHLGEPGVTRRVIVRSIPFILGFTTVFVVLGAAFAAVGSRLNVLRREELVGIILITLGLSFVGLLPMPKQLVAPELIGGARRHGSFLLGAAFSVCAAPCIGAYLTTALALASNRGTLAQGSALLLVYSGGLALGFVAVAVSSARAMSAFRWLRDHYLYVQAASGVVSIGLGVLFFLHRDFWLKVFFNRIFDHLGIGNL
jgi:cytochrome c-type biogenesis protein